MMTKAFSVYDTKALHFGVPFFMLTVGAAVRAFADLVNDPQSSVSKHPTDYVLFHIGEYDDSKGLLIPMSPHANLGLASDHVKPSLAVDRDRSRSVIEKVPVVNSEGGSR